MSGPEWKCGGCGRWVSTKHQFHEHVDNGPLQPVCAPEDIPSIATMTITRTWRTLDDPVRELSNAGPMQQVVRRAWDF